MATGAGEGAPRPARVRPVPGQRSGAGMGDTATTRNVALVGPNGAGKTTLLESMLFVAGADHPQRKGERRDHGRRRQCRGARAPDEHRDLGRLLQGARARLHRPRLPGLGRVHAGDLQRRAGLRCRRGRGRARAGADDRGGAAAPVPGRAQPPAPRLHQQDGPFRGALPRPPAEPAPALDPARGPAPVCDRPRRGSGRLHRPRDRAGLRLQAGRAVGPHPAAGGVSRARADGPARDAGDAGRLRRRPDGEAARGPGAAPGPDPERPAQDAGCGPGGAGVHGRGRAGHGGQALPRGAGEGSTGAQGRTRPSSGSRATGRCWSRC